MTTGEVILEILRERDEARERFWTALHTRARFENALREIAIQDDVEMALDPTWAKRIAKNALKKDR